MEVLSVQNLFGLTSRIQLVELSSVTRQSHMAPHHNNITQTIYAGHISNDTLKALFSLQGNTRSYSL